jgi:hypothetical protein
MAQGEHKFILVSPPMGQHGGSENDPRLAHSPTQGLSSNQGKGNTANYPVAILPS